MANNGNKKNDDILSFIIAGIVGIIGIFAGSQILGGGGGNNKGSSSSGAPGGSGSGCGRCALG